MPSHDQKARPDKHAAAPSRPARLRALLFSGAGLATTLLTFTAAADTKLPPYHGE